MKKLLPYLLPVLTIIALFILSFTKPGITGFAVLTNNDLVTSNIKITLNDKVVVPKDALVTIFLDDKSSSITLEQFILSTNQKYELKQGRYASIDYEGEGFTGNYIYLLPLSEFNLGDVESKAQHELKILISYKDKKILEETQLID